MTVAAAYGRERYGVAFRPPRWPKTEFRRRCQGIARAMVSAFGQALRRLGGRAGGGPKRWARKAIEGRLGPRARLGNLTLESTRGADLCRRALTIRDRIVGELVDLTSDGVL